MSCLNSAAANFSRSPVSSVKEKKPLRNAKVPDRREDNKEGGIAHWIEAKASLQCAIFKGGTLEADLKQKLNDDLRQAMRERNELKTSTLRMLLSAIKYAEIKLGRQVTLTDADILGVIAKEIKQREDSIEAFKQGNRQDLADKETAEMNILKVYMPKQLTGDEIAAEANQIISEVGAKGPGDKGKVMGKLVAKLKGRADGKIINDVVTDLLSKM